MATAIGPTTKGPAAFKPGMPFIRGTHGRIISKSG